MFLHGHPHGDSPWDTEPMAPHGPLHVGPAPTETAQAGPVTTKADAARSELFSHFAPDDKLGAMKAAMAAEHDPKKKLALFEKYYAAKSEADLRQHGAYSGKWFPSDAEREEQRMNARRLTAAKGTAEEIHGDVARLGKKKKLTEKQVQRLIDRKLLEHQLEMDYAVSFTGRGKRDDGAPVHWDQEELEAMQQTFAKLPRDHVMKSMVEARREATDEFGFAAAFADGTFKMFDTGYDDPHAMVHELGHGVHDQKKGAFDKYKKAAGWEEHDIKSLRMAGLTPDEIGELNASRGVDTAKRKQIRKNGKIYQIDTYSHWYTAVDDTAIPEKDQSVVKPSADDPDHWEYPRSNAKEHFAEHYARAVDTPEEIYQDLVGLPAEREAKAQAKAQAAKQRVAALEAKGRDATSARGELAAAYRDLAKAQKAQRQRKSQFDIMRNDVFGTDAEVKAASARLGKRGIAPGLMVDFEEQAARLSTPEQVRQLERSMKIDRP